MKVLIADDHQLFRIGLRSVLRKNDSITAIDEAVNGREAVDKMKAAPCDVVLMDISMPVMNGADATRMIKQEYPLTKVIALSMHDDQQHIAEMMELGASGYMLKNSTDREINMALFKVTNNEQYFSPQISETLVRMMMNKSMPGERISRREREVLCLICHELTSREIATRLSVSEKTVDWHRINLLQKTRSRNTAGLVIFAMKNGIMEG